MARKKSALAHSKVLEAALALFGERGIDATSVTAIAEASGVSKATIYKHWADKDALALEALALMFGLHEAAPKFDSSDLHKDFVDVLTYQPAADRQQARNRIMPHVIAYAARNRQFGNKWRSRVLDPPQARLRALVRRGVTQRKLASDIDMSLALALLLGPMLYWRIVRSNKSGVAVPKGLAKQVVDAFWKAFGTKRR
jgi:AcrR family transcriptional regulator